MREQKQLMVEQIRIASRRAGQIYRIKEIATNETKYIGLTEQTGTDAEESFEVRFGQHARSAINIFKISDMWHIYMAGKLAEYVVKTGLTHISTDLVR